MYFTITRASGGYRAHAYGANHEQVWWTEVYVHKTGAQNAINLMQTGAALAPVHDPELVGQRNDFHGRLGRGVAEHAIPIADVQRRARAALGHEQEARFRSTRAVHTWRSQSGPSQ